MSERIEIKLKPIRKMWYDDVSSNGGYSCITEEKGKVRLSKWDNFLIKGTLPALLLNLEYSAVLIEKEDKRGIHYEVQSIFEDIPSDINKQRTYLSQIITSSQVTALYDAYPNQNIIELIKNNQLDVTKIKGVGKKSLNKIKEKIEQNVEYREAFEFLGQYKINPNLIIKLVKHFKSSKLTVQKIKESPYNLLAVRGIGFIKADEVAMKMKFPKDSEERILAAIEYLIEKNEEDGHTYINKSDLLDKAYELLDVDTTLIRKQLIDTDTIGIYGDCVALKYTYNAEKFVANKLKEMLNQSDKLNFNVDKFVEKQEKERGITLTDQQKGFFYNIRDYNINILSGFAGCGKSQIQALLVDLLDQLGISYLLLSPTGKAAKVLSSYTGREAMTIHRAVRLHNEEDEEEFTDIQEQFIIVDEASMLDIKLASSLLKRINRPDARILFVGDSFQIPSVQAGLFLHDCIESKAIPTTVLNIVFRQKEGGILDIATKIRTKEKFLKNEETGIFPFGNNCVIASVPQDKMESGYKYYYNQLLETYKPEDIMVLSPTKKGNLGTITINENIQEIVNPSSDDKIEIKHGKEPEITFKENDYVLNTKNSYGTLDVKENEVDIMNGDSGMIERIDMDEKEVIVNFDDSSIPITFGNLKQLIHSWCITLHKSQGSGSKAVIVILDKAHKFMGNANLLYTGVSRSKDFLVVLTQAETLNFVMRKNANMQRNTFLKNMLENDM